MSTSTIISLRWMEPIPGEDAKVAVLSEAELEEVREAVQWLEDKAGTDWGDTVPRADLFETKAEGGDMGLREALLYLAVNCRYEEGIYEEDCPAFARHGIPR